MWKQNLLFTGVTLFGIVLVGGTLLSSNRVQPPPRFTLTERDTDFQEVVRKIDSEFAEHWSSVGLVPAPAADESTILRRLSLGLTGAIPSLEELRAVEAVPAEQRLAWWTDRLLSDRRYANHVGERLTRAFVGTDNGPFLVFRRERFRSWLAESLLRNDPYDQLVRSMIAGEGLWTGNPEVNFVTATLESNGGKPDPIRLAARTARAFLGVRIDCLQCHNDQLGTVSLGEPGAPRPGTQRDFHQLAAFYSEAQISLLGIRDRGQDPYKTKLLMEEEEQVIRPVAPFLADERPQGGPLREQLAAWVTSPRNRPFARTTVNRVWAIVSGRPLVEPIDNIPLDGPFPPGMETLVDDFVAHDFDLRRLIRVMVSLRPLQLDSRAPQGVTEELEREWAAFPVTRLRPEQVAGSIIQACSIEAIDADRHLFVRLKALGDHNNFVTRFGDKGDDEFTQRAGTITQRLQMMNGDLITERTRDEPLINAATRIAILTRDEATTVETAYLCVLSRRPTPTELEHFVERLREDGPEGRRECLEDLFWVLLNSTEFGWNH